MPDEAPSPSNTDLSLQDRHVKVKRTAFSKRTESGICDSNGKMSMFCWLPPLEVLLI